MFREAKAVGNSLRSSTATLSSSSTNNRSPTTFTPAVSAENAIYCSYHSRTRSADCNHPKASKKASGKEPVFEIHVWIVMWSFLSILTRVAKSIGCIGWMPNCCFEPSWCSASFGLVYSYARCTSFLALNGLNLWIGTVEVGRCPPMSLSCFTSWASRTCLQRMPRLIHTKLLSTWELWGLAAFLPWLVRCRSRLCEEDGNWCQPSIVEERQLRRWLLECSM